MSFDALARRIWIAAFGLTWLSSWSGSAKGDEKFFTQQPEIAGAEALEPAANSAANSAADAKRFAAGPTSVWIWGAESNGKYALRTTFDATAKAARLKASCDNVLTLYLNGKRIASSNDWQQPADIDVQKFLKPGKNELAAEVENQGGPAGFVLKLAMTLADGKTQYVVSDASWQAAPSRGSDQSAPVRQIAKLGDSPWGDVFSAAAAGPPAGIFLTLSDCRCVVS
ncbi:MAG TPA: hypothetical protein VMV10_26150 [Pirellulales bacterium]|nr:hypothetical protein [Pirellulales bacterium]